jgi:hypothetical protein
VCKRGCEVGWSGWQFVSQCLVRLLDGLLGCDCVDYGRFHGLVVAAVVVAVVVEAIGSHGRADRFQDAVERCDFVGIGCHYYHHHNHNYHAD